MYGFTFDPLVGEFILSHPNIRIPEKGKIYAFNEGNYQAGAGGARGGVMYWHDGTRAAGGGPRLGSLRARSGAAAAAPAAAASRARRRPGPRAPPPACPPTRARSCGARSRRRTSTA